MRPLQRVSHGHQLLHRDRDFVAFEALRLYVPPREGAALSDWHAGEKRDPT